MLKKSFSIYKSIIKIFKLFINFSLSKKEINYF